MTAIPSILIRKRSPLLSGALLFVGLVLPIHFAEAGGQVTLKAVMIHASNTPAPIDQRLERIEYKLRRVFGFEHYRHAGQGSITLALPGEGTIDLGGGYTLRVQSSDGKDGRIRTKVTWIKGGTTLLSTSTRVKRGAPPTVIGGASQGKGKLIVTLVVR